MTYKKPQGMALNRWSRGLMVFGLVSDNSIPTNLED
jgi:hypothetical protein